MDFFSCFDIVVYCVLFIEKIVMRIILEIGKYIEFKGGSFEKGRVEVLGVMFEIVYLGRL